LWNPLFACIINYHPLFYCIFKKIINFALLRDASSSSLRSSPGWKAKVTMGKGMLLLLSLGYGAYVITQGE
jgi:hypothetical protein